MKSEEYTSALNDAQEIYDECGGTLPEIIDFLKTFDDDDDDCSKDNYSCEQNRPDKK